MAIRTIFKNRAPKPEGFFEMAAKRRMEKRLARLAAQYGAGAPKMAIFAHDFVGTNITLYGRLERDEIEDLFLFLAPAMERIGQGTALDIGANIGNHALAFADRFAAVEAFEPNPDVFALLGFNTRARANLRAHNFGLGQESRAAVLVEGAGNLGASRIAAGTAGVPIRIERLDDVAAAARARITFVKIDVEGHEEQVLRGAIETLRRDAPVVVFEQHQGEFKAGTTPAIEILRGLGYTICWSEYPRERVRFSPLRDLLKLRDRLGRRRPAIVTGEVVTVKSHAMLIAVPEGLRSVLGV